MTVGILIQIKCKWCRKTRNTEGCLNFFSASQNLTIILAGVSFGGFLIQFPAQRPPVKLN